MELAQQVQYSGTGRRKDATARVRLVPGSGKITMNGKAIEDYIPFANLRAIVNQPFAVTKTEGQYDVLANVNGGGFSGQAGAIRLAITKALVELDADTDQSRDDAYKKILREAGFLTRDPRVKERKKYGLKKARRAPQFSKR